MKWFLAVVAVLCVFTFACAEETSQANWNTDLGKLGDLLRDKTSGHSHDYAQYQDNDVTTDFAYGAGINLILFQTDPMRRGLHNLLPDTVSVESKYDFANELGSSYLVVTYNLWNMFTKEK